MVRVRMFEGKADALFIRMLLNREDRGIDMPIESLLVLTSLRDGELTTAELAHLLKKSDVTTRGILCKLLTEGMVEQKVDGHAHVYFLGKGYHQAVGEEVAYTKTIGLSHTRQINMVLEHLDQHKRVTCGQIMELCGIVRTDAKKLLLELRESHPLRLVGKGRGAYYEMENKWK